MKCHCEECRQSREWDEAHNEFSDALFHFELAVGVIRNKIAAAEEARRATEFLRQIHDQLDRYVV